MSDRIEALIAALELQQATSVDQGKQIAQLIELSAQQAEHIGLLAQSVAMLLGEETGTPVPEDEDGERVDLDGNPY